MSTNGDRDHKTRRYIVTLFEHPDDVEHERKNIEAQQFEAERNSAGYNDRASGIPSGIPSGTRGNIPPTPGGSDR